MKKLLAVLSLSMCVAGSGFAADPTGGAGAPTSGGSSNGAGAPAGAANERTAMAVFGLGILGVVIAGIATQNQGTTTTHH
jgi:hypothetical protein